MTTHQLRLATSRIRRRPVLRVAFRTPIIRQWKLLEVLSSAPEGIKVEEFAKAAGTCDKTIRRDLILLRKVGFDLDETVGAHGHKSWRVRQSFEKLRSPRQQYKAILNSLDVLLMQVSLVGDRRLVGELEAIRRRVVRKCK
jgi:predicted DNA-binding transcriptional regulator YafY